MEMLRSKGPLMHETGTVYLVGAGPGDPDLLTVKAMRLLQCADVVVLDRLVSQEIVECINADCTVHLAGKRTRHHTLDQDDINILLVSLSRKYKHIVRLKGGDPFIFGRGGEEARVLAEAGVNFEVVPGITSAQGCAAYAGIPLTQRGVAHSVRFITGHFMKNAPFELDIDVIADPSQTLAVYMGLENVQTIVDALLKAGREPTTPVAIVENGTTPRQRRFITNLEELPGQIHERSVVAPAILIVGDVVLLGRELEWFLPVITTNAESRLLNEKSHAFG